MQWRYITANSCAPEGYKNSAISQALLDKGWLRNGGGGGLQDCLDALLYSPTGDTISGSPEQVRSKREG